MVEIAQLRANIILLPLLLLLTTLTGTIHASGMFSLIGRVEQIIVSVPQATVTVLMSSVLCKDALFSVHGVQDPELYYPSQVVDWLVVHARSEDNTTVAFVRINPFYVETPQPKKPSASPSPLPPPPFMYQRNRILVVVVGFLSAARGGVEVWPSSTAIPNGYSDSDSENADSAAAYVMWYAGHNSVDAFFRRRSFGFEFEGVEDRGVVAIQTSIDVAQRGCSSASASHWRSAVLALMPTNTVGRYTFRHYVIPFEAGGGDCDWFGMSAIHCSPHLCDSWTRVLTTETVISVLLLHFGVYNTEVNLESVGHSVLQRAKKDIDVLGLTTHLAHAAAAFAFSDTSSTLRSCHFHPFY
jgi:hypothetical protein